MSKAEKLKPVPAGEKIERDGGEVTPLEPSMVALILRGWTIKNQMDELDVQLKAINAEILAAHDVGVSLSVPGVCRVITSERETVKISEPTKLQRLLGPRFADLVRVETAYKPEPRLLAIATDGDDPLAAGIGECLSLSHSASVSWRPEK